MEAAASLLVLPVGAVLAFVSALAMLGLVLAGLFLTFLALALWNEDGAAGTALVAFWCWAGGVTSAYNAVTAVEAIGTLAWRPMLRVIALAGLIVLLYPGLWLPSGMVRLGLGP
ncbi:hypothetical protein [uncultured Sphingomonas sp.]|uniref:hypothetical protein n=1 Tax=uncultured Sphingomonas sp. TaxID=158754 RepID=UPI0035CA83D8